MSYVITSLKVQCAPNTYATRDARGCCFHTVIE